MDHSSNSLKKIPDDRGTRIVRLLNKQLADTLDLRSQARQSYFNVKGSYTDELRSLFAGLAWDLRYSADLIARCINRAGGYAIATVRSVADESGLRDYPEGILDAHEQLEAMLSSYSRYELDTQQNIKAAQEMGDPGTIALLQLISASIENNLWFLEAYLEGIAVGLHGRKLPSWTSTLSSQPKTDQSGSPNRPELLKAQRQS
jgi:starvation-inducible DNA-binding protein